MGTVKQWNFSNFIPPDYSDEDDSDLNDDGDIEMFDEAEDDEKIEQLERNNNNMITGTSSPSWGSGSSINNNPNNRNGGWSWGGYNNDYSSRPQHSSPWYENNNTDYQNQRSYAGFWNSRGNENNKISIDRTKKVIFCNVLDCLVTNWNKQPGVQPRGIYDILPRFEVWDRLFWFNPERVFAIAPTYSIIINGRDESWEAMLNYIGYSLTEYLKLKQNCNILATTDYNYPVSRILEGAICDLMRDQYYPYRREDMLYIGVNSGLSRQSNSDILAAKACNIDYLDLETLLNNYQ